MTWFSERLIQNSLKWFDFENELKWFNIGERLIQNGQMIWLKWRENVSHERFVVQIFEC